MFVGTSVRRPPGTPGGSGLSSLGRFDFVNDLYTWQGTPLTAADVTDQTAWITADGLEIPGSSGTSAELIYAPAQTFLAGCQWTMVLEVEILNTGFSPSTYLFTETNAGEAFFIQVSFAAEWELTASDGSNNPFALDFTHSVSTGIHRFAVTQTDDRCSLSVDGFAVETDTEGVTLPVPGFPMVNFYFGGYSTGTGRAVNIRSVTIYETVDDSSLPSLSL